MTFLGDKSKRGKRTPKILEGEERNRRTAGNQSLPRQTAVLRESFSLASFLACPLRAALARKRLGYLSIESTEFHKFISRQSQSRHNSRRGLRLANNPRGTMRICEQLTCVDSPKVPEFQLRLEMPDKLQCRFAHILTRTL